MRTRLTTLLATLAMTLAALVPATARADSDGTAGVVQRIHVAAPGSDAYSNNHAWLQIGSDYYYSGGSLCTGVAELTEADLERLNVALVNGLTVNPWYIAVSGNRCLTAYMLYAP